MFRRQLPVYSPLPADAITAGLGALLGGGRPEDTLLKWLAGTYGGEALLLDSGTSALALAMLGVVLERGGPGLVALPAYGCYDLATAADMAGVRVVLYDLDPATLGPDWNSFDAALAAGADAVVMVHYYGLATDLTEAARRAARSGTVVIEDAAQGSGGRLGGRLLGSLAPVTVLSFGRGKGMTGGGGGALVARGSGGPALLQRVRSKVGPNHAASGVWLKAVAQWALARPAIYGLPAALPFLGLGETVYRPPHPVTGMSRVSQAVLSRTRGPSEAEVATRSRNAGRLLARVRGGFLPFRLLPGSEPGFLRLPLLAGEAARQRVAGAAVLGVLPGYPRALDQLPGFERRLASRPHCPGARHLARRLVTLPTHGQLAEADLVRLDRWLDSCRGLVCEPAAPA